MNSASKVGEIFTKAGETFHKLADMTVMLDSNTKELLVGGAKVRFNINVGVNCKRAKTLLTIKSTISPH